MKKQYAVKQDEDDRKNFDKRWEKLNSKLKSTDPQYSEPEGKCQSDGVGLEKRF